MWAGITANWNMRLSLGWGSQVTPVRTYIQYSDMKLWSNDEWWYWVSWEQRSASAGIGCRKAVMSGHQVIKLDTASYGSFSLYSGALWMRVSFYHGKIINSDMDLIISRSGKLQDLSKVICRSIYHHYTTTRSSLQSYWDSFYWPFITQSLFNWAAPNWASLVPPLHARSPGCGTWHRWLNSLHFMTPGGQILPQAWSRHLM